MNLNKVVIDIKDSDYIMAFDMSSVDYFNKMYPQKNFMDVITHIYKLDYFSIAVFFAITLRRKEEPNKIITLEEFNNINILLLTNNYLDEVFKIINSSFEEDKKSRKKKVKQVAKKI